MKTRLATIFSALIAPVLLAQDAATPSPTPVATPAAQTSNAVTEAVTEPQSAPDATPATDAITTSGSMTLSGTAAAMSEQDGSLLFSEPNLESTAPDQNFMDVPPGSETDRMPAGGPTFRKTKTSEAAEELKERVRVRQAKTRALEDSKVQEALERADAAQTLPERREALRDYYTALYDRMARIDPSVKKSVEELRKQSLGKLDDSQIKLAKKSRGSRR